MPCAHGNLRTAALYTWCVVSKPTQHAARYANGDLLELRRKSLAVEPRVPLRQALGEYLVVRVRALGSARRFGVLRQLIGEDGLPRRLTLPRLLGHHKAHDLRVHVSRCGAEPLVKAQLVAFERHHNAAIARQHERTHVLQAHALQCAEQKVSCTRRVFRVFGVLFVHAVEIIVLDGRGRRGRRRSKELRHRSGSGIEQQPKLRPIVLRAALHRGNTRSLRGEKSRSAELQTQARTRISLGDTSIS